MGYLKSTIKYLKRSWWVLALCFLPSAVLLGFFARPILSIGFIYDYMNLDVKNYSDIFWLFINKVSLTHVYPIILMFVIIFIAVTIIFSVIEKHLRVGRLLIRKPFSEVNNYFLPVFFMMLIFSAMLCLYFIINISLITLFHFIISGAGVPSMVSGALAVIINFILFIVLIILMSLFIYVIPLQNIFGYSFTESLSMSIKYVGDNKIKILTGIFIPLFLVALIEFIVSSISPPDMVSVIINTILHLAIFVYMIPYTMITFFKISGLERKDNKKYYQI